MVLANITKKPPPKSSGGTRTQVFRTQLYRYGKLAGTAKVMPGISNTSVGRFLGDSRKRAYPLARAIGNVEALMGGNLLAQVIGRATRVGTGALSGRFIDMAVRPLGLPPFIARQARVQLGKRLSRETKLDRHLKNATQTVFGTVKINGKASNEATKRIIEIQKDAQKLLMKIERRVRAYAPDVSSGQYFIGMDNLGTKTQREGLIDNVAMNSQAKFEKMGIKNFVGGPKYTYRDIFGFEKPGEARRFLHASIERDNVFRAHTGENFFFYGELNVGGSPLFPWIHAVEYGGKLPYYQRTGRGGKGGAQGYKDHLNTGNAMENLSDLLKNYNKGAAKGQYSILKYRYVPPTMFIYRGAADSLAEHRTASDIQYLGDIDQSSTKYFTKWNEIARKRNAKSIFNKNQTSYTKPSNTKDTVDTLYKMNKATNRKANFRSRMEGKIPGPRVEMAHGSFYSQELAGAIGLEMVPEEFRFKFTIPKGVRSPFEGHGTPFTQEFLGKLAETYVKSGGGRDDTIKRMTKQIMNDNHPGNMLRSRNLKTLTTKRSVAQGPGVISPSTLRSHRKKFGKVIYNDPRSKVMVANQQAQKEAARLYDMFSSTKTSIKSMGKGGERTKVIFRGMYQLQARRKGDGVVIYSKLRKGRGNKASKQSSAERTALEQLSKEFLSDMEVDEIYKGVMGMDF